jgi:hypothetical protein
MNFTRKFKWQMILVALGASLVMTGKVYSQEIENTRFETPATSVGTGFNTPAPVVANSSAANPQTAMEPTAAVAIQPAGNAVEGLGAESFSLTAGPLLAIAIIIVGGVIARKISVSRGSARQNAWNADSVRNKALANRKPQVLQS